MPTSSHRSNNGEKMTKNFPQRKHPRLKNYDYSLNGCYFVTLCIKNKQQLLGNIYKGKNEFLPPQIELSTIGKVVEKFILRINTAYENAFVDNYVIMPDHIDYL